MKMKVKGKVLALLIGLLLVAIPSYAAESVTPGYVYPIGTHLWAIEYTITTAADGSITATTFTDSAYQILRGKYFIQVTAFPTVGGTAPDAADLVMHDEQGNALLGSVDGGTTAYAGLNLIHATLTKSCLPSMYLTGQDAHINYYWPVTSKFTFDIINQATDSANITLRFIFSD